MTYAPLRDKIATLFDRLCTVCGEEFAPAQGRRCDACHSVQTTPVASGGLFPDFFGLDRATGFDLDGAA